MSAHAPPRAARRNKSVATEMWEMMMLLPDSFRALVRKPKRMDPNEVPAVDDEEIFKPVLQSIGAILFFKTLCTGCTKTAQVKLMVRAHGGDTVKAATSLGRLQALGALLEFTIGPLLGKLSDVLGRKFVMRLNPLVFFLHYACVLTNPTAPWALYTRAIVIAVETAFYANTQAIMADVMSGPNIAENGYLNMALAGLGLMGAPFIAKLLSTKQKYIFSAALTLICAFVVNRLPETLPKKCRAPANSLDWASCNPLAFFHLFTHGRTLATLSVVSAMETFTDPRLLDEPGIMVMRQKLQWAEHQVQNQLAVMSYSQVNGSGTAKFSVKFLGRIGHTHFSHCAKFVALLLWSQASSTTMMCLTQFVHMFAQRQRDGVETLMTDIGSKNGLGKGQMSAYKFNLRSISNLLAPLMYARLFAIGKSIGDTGIAFIGGASTVALAELIFCSLSELPN